MIIGILLLFFFLFGGLIANFSETDLPLLLLISNFIHALQSHILHCDINNTTNTTTRFFSPFLPFPFFSYLKWPSFADSQSGRQYRGRPIVHSCRLALGHVQCLGGRPSTRPRDLAGQRQPHPRCEPHSAWIGVLYLCLWSRKDLLDVCFFYWMRL